MQTMEDMPGVQLSMTAGSLVLPGDDIARLVDAPPTASDADARKRAVVRLGPGMTQRDRELCGSKCGVLRTDAKRNKLWLETNQRRYIPALEDMIIGIVQEKHTDEYRLDISGTDTAVLSSLAFEGATKKNKPVLGIGSVVYSRVTRASKNMEVEVSCVEPGSSRSWSGGETLYGELKGGNLITVSLAMARTLIKADNVVLSTLGERFAFQSAVGLNGRVWLQAKSAHDTIVLSEAVKRADVLERDEWKAFIENLFSQKVVKIDMSDRMT